MGRAVPSLLFDLRPNYGRDNKDNGDLLQKVACMHRHTQCPRSCSRPPPTHSSTGDSWTLTGKSGSVSCGVTAPFSWALVLTRVFCALQESVSLVLCKFCNQIPLASKVKFPGGSQPLLPDLQVGKSVVGPRTFLAVQEFIWYNCSAVCGSSAQQLYGGVNGDLIQEGLCHTQVCCTQSPYPCTRPLLTCTSTGDSNIQRLIWPGLCGVSWCAQDFVWALRASLASMGFESKCDFAPPTVLLGLFLCLWTWGIFFWWDPTFACWWLFSSKL